MDVVMNCACNDLICQHPSCWRSRHRPLKLRKEPWTNKSRNNSQHAEEELPTQKIMNLLADYGPDPRDRYKSDPRDSDVSKSCSADDSREHSKAAVTSSQDVLRVWAPHTTPISQLAQRSSTGQMSTMSEPRHTRLNMVQVQEVFDLSDLQANYSDTFCTRPYYIWVPRTSKSESWAEDKKATPGTSQMKDLTELMIPKEVATSREKSTMKRRTVSSRSSWLRQSSNHSLVRHYVSPASQSDPQVSPSCNTQLTQLSQSCQQTPVTTGNVKYDKHFSRRQYPIVKPMKGKHSVMHHGPGVFQLLDLPKDVLVEILGHLSQSDCSDEKKFSAALMKALRKVAANKRNESLVKSQVLKQRKMKLLDLSEKTQDASKISEMHWQHINNKTAQTQINDVSSSITKPTKVLPPVVSSKHKVLSAIGLHGLPPGSRGAKPFYYKKTDANFTLGRVTPPERASEPFPAPNWLSSAQLSRPSRQLVENAIASATHGTRLQRQMTTDSTTSANREATAAHLEMNSYSDAKGSSCVDRLPDILPDHWVAKCPLNTPQTPANSVDVRPITTSRGVSGVLGTIPENDSDQCLDQSTIPPRSRRSVRFADNVPNADIIPSSALEIQHNDSPQPPHHTGQSMTRAADNCLQESGGMQRDSQSDSSSTKSAKLTVMMQMEPCVSPGPPPPSPEPKDGATSPATCDKNIPEVEDMPDDQCVSLLEAFLESDSEINLSARPPSTLDDISRINTPLPTPP